ncbi:hypothetical protein PPL_05758 [Heterostelium album PN500]|uniref:Uncharacterized protein n=1 Tax=Heterostelium pallidum (strain ATCC 26659 / Pp 5 / PN500) TaxID=670386 RepID=D3BB26_HETP5|nr:hypothetical protein PPL_05758 [Heterostelium album PN500]EFA81763.1 hypothetical protein PPL_05758 [Heterostelium album PN500]|eukprot:XP_020433880.1 hypothetical protein PPL_05758 [Heterostelium album PN500]
MHQNENKKLIFDLEKEKKKDEKLKKQQQLLAETQAKDNNNNSSSSSSSSSPSKSSISFSSNKSYASPFKKITIKNGQVVKDVDSSKKQSSAQASNATLHVKQKNKIGLADKIENNTLHVFLSSTFKDMIGERDHLIKVVFPALNMKAKSKNLTIVPVDLRWGLTKEETTLKGQIELCLKQIEKCPVTIGMVGSRVGWIPSEYKLEDPNSDASKWLSALPLGHSITTIEILYALEAAASGKKHCIAALRESNEHFVAEDADAERRLHDTRQTLINHSHCSTIANYPATGSASSADKYGNIIMKDLDVFGDFILQQLWEIIELEFPTPVLPLDQLEREKIAHSNALQARSAHYFGRASFQQKLKAHINDNSSIDRIGLVYGEPGSGKSSSLAYLAKSLESDPQWLVLYHFIGCSSESTDVTNILASFSAKLIQQFKLKFELSESFEKLRIDFPIILSKCKGRKILILIDDLDELNPANQSHQMEWLPESSELPNNVFVFLSCDQGKVCWDYLHLRSKIPQTFYLNPLEMSDRQLIVEKTLDLFGKRLDSKQCDRLISKTQAKLPLFIKLVCEELRIFGSFDRLAMFIAKLPETIPQLIDQMITRLEDDFGKDLIRKTLCYIALSRYGLTETELLDLLARNSTSSSTASSVSSKLQKVEPLAFVVWAPLLSSLSPLLRQQTNHITFFHGQIANVIIRRYLSIERSAIAVHQTLADYYLAHADPDAKRNWSGVVAKPYVELPYHLMCAKRFDQLSTLFQDLRFIESNFQRQLGRELIERFLSVLSSVRGPALTGERWTGYNFSTVNTVEDFFAFVQYQSHHLTKFPFVAAQLALNLPDDAVCHAAASKLLNSERRLHLNWVNKSQISDFVISTLAGHEDFVRAALYKDDGSLLASCSDDRSIRLWSGETGQLVRVFPKLHTDKVTQLAWRNNTIITVSRDKRIVMWDEYGRVISEFANGHSGAVWGVDVAGNGNRFVTASWDGTAIVWDVATKKPALTLSAHSPQKLSACAYSHNNKWVATGCWGGVLIVWDANTGAELKRFKVSDMTILCIQFSHDDTMISLSSVDTNTHVYSTTNWTKIAKLEGHNEAVISARFSSDSKYLVSCSDDKTVRVYETAEWTQVSLMTGHSGRIISCAFHPSSARRQVVTGATDKFIKIWDPKLGYSVAQIHQGHRKAVNALQYVAETNTLYSVADDKTVKVWSDFTRNDTLTLEKTIELSLKDFVIDPVQKNMIGVNGNGCIIVADLNGKIIKRFEKAANSISVSPNFKHVGYLHGKEGQVSIMDLESGSEVYSARHGFVLNQIGYSPTGEYVVVSDGKGTFTALKCSPTTSNYSMHSHITLEPMDAITGIGWSSNGNLLAIGTNNGSTYIFDVKRSFYQINVLKGHAFAVRALAFTPDASHLLTASLDKQALLWDLQTSNIATIFPLASISTSNILIFNDHQNVITIAISDYTGKIHHLKFMKNS